MIHGGSAVSNQFLLVPLVLAVYLWVFWTLFVLVMGFYRAKLSGRLKGMSLVMAIPWVAIGYSMDVMANMTIASIIFVDIPHEMTVTNRLQRYLAKEKGWRNDLAFWVCQNLLDVFDPNGSHC